MRICDKCPDRTRARFTLLLIEDDTSTDLCERHKDEIMNFIAAKDKQTFFRRKKKKTTAKAG